MDKIFLVNFKGALLLISEALPFMKGRKGANIVLMSSLSGYVALDTVGFYSISKTMILVMNKLLAKEL